MLELAAAVVVVSIIAIGMTSGAQAVMLHYQSDTVRQDLRQYGNQIMREIARELNLAQKVEIDGQNGFSRIKLYKYFTTFCCPSSDRQSYIRITPLRACVYTG